MKTNLAVVLTVALVGLGLGVLFGWPARRTTAASAPELTATQSPTATPTLTSLPSPTPISLPVKVFLPLVLKAEPPSLQGALKILRINANPIGAGGTAYASWNITDFRAGEFDRGDGKGYIGPIASAMTVDVRNVTTPQLVRLRWRDLSGQEFEDTLILFVDGTVATPAPTPTIFVSDCNPSNPDWRGAGTAAYTFCVRKDLGYVTGDAPVRYFNVNQDVALTLDWHIYGINGIRFVIEPSAQVCGPSGTSVFNVATSGQGSYTFNVNQLAYGGYIVHLKVTRKDNMEVNYNEKFLCISNNPGSTTPTAPTPTPNFVPTAIPPGGGTPPTPIP